MAAGTTTIAEAAERQRRLELKALLQKQYKWIDRKWDLVFWVTAIFVVAGAADITKQLFAGDWDFWTDWKDPQWWPVITAFATIILMVKMELIAYAARLAAEAALSHADLRAAGMQLAVHAAGGLSAAGGRRKEPSFDARHCTRRHQSRRVGTRPTNASRPGRLTWRRRFRAL